MGQQVHMYDTHVHTNSHKNREEIHYARYIRFLNLGSPDVKSLKLHIQSSGGFKGGGAKGAPAPPAEPVKKFFLLSLWE